MRGHMFEVATDIDELFSLTENSLYDSVQALEVDYVSNVDKEMQHKLVLDFIHKLESCGADFEIITVEEGYECFAVSNITLDVKKNYFKQRFDLMKKLASEITLEEFSDNQNNANLFNLKTSISDDWGDMVYLNYCCYTLDYFIRNADPDFTYYFGNVVYLH